MLKENFLCKKKKTNLGFSHIQSLGNLQNIYSPGSHNFKV